MPKILYPFSAVPNQVCRGGHGPINLAVLTVLLSHGKSSASAQTIADEVGCDRKSVFSSYKYWMDNGAQHGIVIHTKKRQGLPTIYEVEVTRCEKPVPKTVQVKNNQPVPETVHGRTENGTGTRTENGTQRITNQEEPIEDIYIGVEKNLSESAIGRTAPSLLKKFINNWNQEVVFQNKRMAFWQKEQILRAFDADRRLEAFVENKKDMEYKMSLKV